MYNGENTSKNDIVISNSQLVSAVAVFKGHNSERDLQQDIMLLDVSWLM